MADPNKYAQFLRDPDQIALDEFNRIEAQGQKPWYQTGLPMEGRATFLPFKDSMEGSVFNQREWALPAVVAGAVNAFTAPERARTGTDPNFNANEEALNLAQNVMGGGISTSSAMKAPMGYGGKDLALNAWHGTPHEVRGGFDLSKVGTGEGAQAYGHGMYFGEARGTGEAYAKELGSGVYANDKPLIRNNQIVGSTGNKELDDYIIANWGDKSKTRRQLLDDIKDIRTHNPEAAKEMQKTLADLRSADLQVKGSGNLYKVDIPDEQIPMMLDWDKPLSEQMHIWDKLPQSIKNSIDEAMENRGLNPMSETLDELKGHHLYNALKHHDVHENLPPEIGKSSWFTGETTYPQHTSAYLESLGIPGIRYLDEQSRGNFKAYATYKGKKYGDVIEFKSKNTLDDYIKEKEKEGFGVDVIPPTRNFVVFKPETVKILEKNDKPIDRKELLKEQIDKLSK
jgi:hypothetical protein